MRRLLRRYVPGIYRIKKTGCHVQIPTPASNERMMSVSQLGPTNEIAKEGKRRKEAFRNPPKKSRAKTTCHACILSRFKFLPPRRTNQFFRLHPASLMRALMGAAFLSTRLFSCPARFCAPFLSLPPPYSQGPCLSGPARRCSTQHKSKVNSRSRTRLSTEWAANRRGARGRVELFPGSLLELSCLCAQNDRLLDCLM